MLKNLVKDSIFYTISTLFIRGVAFFMLPIYTRFLQPEDYGLLDYISVIGIFIGIFFGLEILQGLARSISDLMDDQQKKVEYASTCLWFILIGQTLLLPIAFLFKEQFSILLFASSDKGNLVVLAAISYWISAVFGIIHGQLRWELKSKLSAILSFINAVFVTLSTVVLVINYGLGVHGVLLGQIIGGSISLFICFYAVRKSFKFTFSFNAFKKMLNFSAPLIPSSFAVILSQYADRFFLKEYTSFDDMGIFAVAQKISAIITLSLVGFRGALTPLIYSNYTKKSTPKDIATIFTLFCFMITLMLSGMVIFSPELISFLTSIEYVGAQKVFPILALSAVFSSAYIFFPGMDILNKTKNIAKISIIVALINVLLNYLLIGELGIMGAALSSLISSTLYLFLYISNSQDFYPVPHDWELIAYIFTIGFVCVAGCNYFLHESFIARFAVFLIMVLTLIKCIPKTYIALIINKGE